MLDARIRPLIDPPLNAAARVLIRMGATPARVTTAGFMCALACFYFLAFMQYAPALVFLLAGRLMDGLDGPVARQMRMTGADGKETTGESDAGAFMDIVSDFIFYSGAVFFFALGQPQYALWAAFLIFSFMAAGSSFLAYAIFAGKRGLNHEEQCKKGFYYLSGIAEGTETIVVLSLMCLLPQYFPLIAGVYGVLCLLTAAGRVRQGIADFSKAV